MSSFFTIVLITIAFLVLFELHACTARNPPHFHSFLDTLQDDGEKTKLLHLHQLYINTIIPASQEVATSSSAEEDTSVSLLMDMQGLKLKKRSVLESTNNNDDNNNNNKSNEASDANEGEPVEDTVVMDYVQIHRKSPIHNHH